MEHVVDHEPATPRDGWTAFAGHRPCIPPVAARDSPRPVVGGARADSAEDYRLAMRNLATAVTVVTTRCGSQIHGMTASAVCCVSLAPPLLLVCIAKNTRTHRLIEQAGIFAVHLLHQAQRDLADHFAGRFPENGDRFHGLDYVDAATGAPVLLDSLAYLDCRVTAAHDGGDHTIFLGAVEAIGRRELGRPLIYLQGTYVDLCGPTAYATIAGAVDDELPLSFARGGQP
jgi:flavin reductase (DIM6/NTAB) family NADH-FMN oxidoreductase RutF